MRILAPRKTRTVLVAAVMSGFALLAVLLAGALFADGSAPSPRSEQTPVRLQQSAPQQTALFPDLPTWRPNVIFNDGLESTTFTVFRNDIAPEETVWITAGGVLVPDSAQPLGAEAIHQDLIRLYDDGTNGDAFANDNFYSRSGITATGPLSHDGGTHQALTVDLVFFTNTGGGGTQHGSSTMPNSPIGIVDTSQKGAIAAFQLSPSLSATSHALFLQDDGTLFPTYPNVDEELVVDAFAGCVACELLVGQFGDQFDLISLQVSERLPSQGSSAFVAFNQFVANDVEGIGRELFNNNFSPTSVTGSTERLRAIIWENEIDVAALTHEVFHTWGVDIGLNAGFNEGTGHFGPNNTLNGVIDQELEDGGVPLFRDDQFTDLVANGDGTHRVVARPGAYNATLSPLSLYLAGLIPPEQVAPWDVLTTPDFSDLDRVTAGSVTTLTIDDVIAEYGPRVPAVGASPTDFRLGVVVFKNRAFTEADYAFATLALQYFESSKPYDGTGAPPWNSATLGLGTITVALPAFSGDPIDFSGAPPDDTETPPDDSETPPDDSDMLTPLSTSRPVSISPGWNLIGWTGDDVSTTLALATIVDFVRNVFAWDPLFGTFYSYSPLAPSFLNDLDVLFTGDGLWLFSTANTVITWDVPVVADGRQSSDTHLAPGANLVTWLGANDTSIADAVAGLGNAFLSLQTWDPFGETFLIYAAGIPIFLNTLTTLHFGDAVWINVTRAADWPQYPNPG